MVFRKLLLFLLCFLYSSHSFSMLSRFTKYFKGKRTKTGQTKYTRQTKTSKKQGFSKGFSREGQAKFETLKKPETKKFAALPILTTTALVPLAISDEEKKEDHEKLERLLSQESFDQNTNEEIYELLNKYGYTEEMVYALLEGFIANQRLLYSNDTFELNKKEGIFYTKKGSFYDSGVLFNADDVNEGIVSKRLKEKTNKEHFRFIEVDPDDIKDINIAKLKISMAEDIWSFMPWILKNNIRREQLFKIDLSNPLQMSVLVRDSALDIPFHRPRWALSRYTEEDRKMVEENTTYQRLCRHALLLEKYYAALDFLPKEKRAICIAYETQELKQPFNTINYEKTRMIVNAELKMLKNLKEHCEGAGCDWIDQRIIIFEKNFQGIEDQEPSKKSGTLFSPSTYESVSVKTTPDKQQPKTYSFWGQIVNYLWPSYYYLRK
jgi:hypothetical protein